MIDKKELYRWCAVKAEALPGHPALKTRFRLVADSAEMGALMARELVDEIAAAAREGKPYNAIIPCGPNCWYRPFTELVNAERVSLRHVMVFHMDECLNWEGKPLPEGDPYNFKSFMLRHFYGPVRPELAVPTENRVFLHDGNYAQVSERVLSTPIDITYGGWGQDGHIAYNQSRRHPYSAVTVEQLRQSTARVQDNNPDTILALSQRSFGAAYQFVPPMSVTLGIRECLSAGKVRLFSDTGAWKQTALRVALFLRPDPEYPMTLLGEHPDALITATMSTAEHPISLHPEWEFECVNV